MKLIAPFPSKTIKLWDERPRPIEAMSSRMLGALVALGFCLCVVLVDLVPFWVISILVFISAKILKLLIWRAEQLEVK